MVQTNNRANSESIVGLLIFCAILASAFGIYAVPFQRLETWLNADLETAYVMLSELGLFDRLHDLVGLEGIANEFGNWVAQLKQEASAAFDNSLGHLERRLIDAELQFVRSLGFIVLLIAVRGMVVLGALVLFAPAIALLLFLAMRSREIRSAGFAQTLTPFMQGIQVRLLWAALVGVLVCSLAPIVPIQLAVTLLILWIGAAGFVVARVQKL